MKKKKKYQVIRVPDIIIANNLRSPKYKALKGVNTIAYILSLLPDGPFFTA